MMLLTHLDNDKPSGV